MWKFVKRIAKAILYALTVVALTTFALAVKFIEDGYDFFLPAHGTKLGEDDGVAVYSAEGYSDRGTYGLEFQCVELVNRVWVEKAWFRNLTQTGHADSYYWEAADKGLVAYPNGSAELPRTWDALVFDTSDHDGSVGHVAVVTSVSEDRVNFIQQNFTECKMYGLLCRYRWHDSLPLTRSGDGWSVSQGDYPFPVAGWSRPSGPFDGPKEKK